ncbi:MAG: TPM domain-containing protein [Alphaproteobacteria bacterium]|nr:TPM domain-containing protein [Alphaproteobacteria bacterium]MBU0794937.1 TPM domain-containing protein [Alphaproteobacteria bacterium]MBU0875918.1 TPM domain-containing protein [Alphaproteobacteria bacterium]MBU1770872.1 TPM domain-containing protein [Alphaproteobacteria bacterium]
MLRAALLLLVALVLVLRPDAAFAQNFPDLTGRVVDGANILDPQTEAALTQQSEALEQTTGRQLVVATVPSLDGYEISDYGYQLGRAWGIGEKETNSGVLLLVAPNEKRLTIQVGYGLEPILTDALSGRIIRDVITPRFRAGDFPGGISAGVSEIVRILELPPEEQRKLAATAAEQSKRQSSQGFGPLIFFAIFILFFVVLPIFSRLRGGRRYRGGIHPIVIWGAEAAIRGALNSRDGGGWGGGGGGGGGFSGGGGGFGGGGASGGW